MRISELYEWAVFGDEQSVYVYPGFLCDSSGRPIKLDPEVKRSQVCVTWTLAEERFRVLFQDFPGLYYGLSPRVSVVAERLPKSTVLLHTGGRTKSRQLSEKTVRSICSAMDPRPVFVTDMELPKPPKNVIGGPLPDLSALLGLLMSPRVAAMISPFTGPMHLAFAVGLPTVGLCTHDRSANWGHDFPGSNFVSVDNAGACPDKVCLEANGGFMCSHPHPWTCTSFNADSVIEALRSVWKLDLRLIPKPVFHVKHQEA